MNIFTRIKNNVQYAYYRKLSDVAIANMKKHVNEESSTEFKKWAKIGFNSLMKCLEIQIK